jgi:uncharacterized protein (TIGR04255 family)
MTKTPQMPLQGPSPDEVPLPDAPLVSVIAQVRFPTLLGVRNPDRVAPFQEAIRSQYPHLERQEIPAIVVVAGGAPNPMSEAVATVHWRFADEAAGFKWRVSLSQDFVALETRAYESRQDFMERLETILQTLGETLAPTHMMRFGMRYIDQIKGEPLARIDTLLRREVLGVVPCAGPDARQVITEFAAPAEPGELLARWGRLPVNMTVDPNVLPPVQEDSWLIDLDVSHTGQVAFEAKGIVETARSAAERVYAVFRWMVTEEFLKAYGGKV